MRKASFLAFAATMSLGSLASAQTDPNQPAPPGGTAPAPGQATPGGATITLTPGGATTSSGQPKDQGKKEDAPKAEKKPLIWRGSTLIFDQSTNPETIGIGADRQTDNPVYQLWFSARPRFTFYQDKKQSFNVNFRLDYYKELTNSDDTTKYRQGVFGDLWLNAAYTRQVYKGDKVSTSLSFGPRFLFPVSMESRARNVITTAGVFVTAINSFKLAKGEWFSSARGVVQLAYTHPFTKYTTSSDSSAGDRGFRTTNDNANRPSQDARTGENNQLSGGMLVQHQLLTLFDTGIQITPKLGVTLDMIFISQWRHRPTAYDTCTSTTVLTGSTGCIQPSASNPDPPRYSMLTWFLIGPDYQITDELNLSTGYYHVTNSIGPDGSRRNVFYTPDAGRVYFTMTVGLDQFYERLMGKDEDKGSGTQNRVARTAPGSVLGQPF